MTTRKVHLVLEVEMDVDKTISDEAVYEAICNHFAGPESKGLMAYPGSSVVVSNRYEIAFYQRKTVYMSYLG